LVPKITLNLPSSITVQTPFGPMTFKMDFSTQFVFAYLQVMADAINKRVANPADKTIVIPPPATPPQTVTTQTPFGLMNFQLEPETLFVLNALGQLAAGINAVWGAAS